MLEVPLRRNVLQFPAERPGETVEWAADLAALPILVFQLAATMQTGIGERHDGVGRIAHDDVRRAGDGVDDVVAHCRDFFLAAGELPHPAPEVGHFAVVPFAGDVAIDRHIGATEVLGCLEAQHIGHRMRIGVEQLLIGDARRAGIAQLTGGVGGGHLRTRPG